MARSRIQRCERIMRAALGLTLATIALLSSTALSVHAACPARAIDASWSLWPRLTLPPGSNVRARHSCGRMVRCFAAGRGIRRCSWE